MSIMDDIISEEIEIKEKERVTHEEAMPVVFASTTADLSQIFSEDELNALKTGTFNLETMKYIGELEDINTTINSLYTSGGLDETLANYYGLEALVYGPGHGSGEGFAKYQDYPGMPNVDPLSRGYAEYEIGEGFTGHSGPTSYERGLYGGEEHIPRYVTSLPGQALFTGQSLWPDPEKKTSFTYEGETFYTKDEGGPYSPRMDLYSGETGKSFSEQEGAAGGTAKWWQIFAWGDLALEETTISTKGLGNITGWPTTGIHGGSAESGGVSRPADIYNPDDYIIKATHILDNPEMYSKELVSAAESFLLYSRSHLKVQKISNLNLPFMVVPITGGDALGEPSGQKMSARSKDYSDIHGGYSSGGTKYSFTDAPGTSIFSDRKPGDPLIFKFTPGSKYDYTGQGDFPSNVPYFASLADYGFFLNEENRDKEGLVVNVRSLTKRDEKSDPFQILGKFRKDNPDNELFKSNYDTMFNQDIIDNAMIFTNYFQAEVYTTNYEYLRQNINIFGSDSKLLTNDYWSSLALEHGFVDNSGNVTDKIYESFDYSGFGANYPEYRGGLKASVHGGPEGEQFIPFTGGPEEKFVIPETETMGIYGEEIIKPPVTVTGEQIQRESEILETLLNEKIEILNILNEISPGEYPTADPRYQQIKDY